METPQKTALPAIAAVYFPAAGGTYEVKPNLKPLGTDFGNGAADSQIFQVDAGYGEYRRVKQRARAERLDKYYQTRDFSPEVAGPICRFIALRLAEEHPALFALDAQPGEWTLRSALHGETLRFDPEMRQVRGGDAVPSYADPFDALAAQVQEDLVVVRRVQGADWTCAIHLCCPYRWTAEEKIGLDFVTMHAPVPGMEPFRRAGMVTNMVKHGPLVRFVWEVTTDARLNHHPQPPPDADPADWQATRFDPRHPRLFLRVEREVFWSFPDQEAALMAVRTSFRSGEEIRREVSLRQALGATIESMTPEALRYKGLAESRDDILAWLRSGPEE
jgi:hypothetical protein